MLGLLASCAADPPPPPNVGPPPGWMVPAYPAPYPMPPAPAPMPIAPASMAPPPAPSPAERLAQSRAARIAEARALLGEGAQIEEIDDVFVLAGAPGYAGFRAAADLARQAAAAYFNNRIRTRPDRAIPLYVFGTTATYDAFCRAREGQSCVSPLGFYDPTPGLVMVNAQLGLGSLTHEMMHPLIEIDFPGAPDWFDEGVASLFGKAVFPRPGEVHGATNWRLPELKRALSSPKTRAAAGIDQLFGMPAHVFRNRDQGLHYAMARYLCQWLDQQDKLWPFYHRWRDQLAADPTGARSFEEVTGKNPLQANAEWIRWVLALR